MHRLLTTFAVALLTFTQAAAQDVRRELVPVTDDIWRFINNNHATMVVVTDAGIVVGDPINAAAATWLRDEIASRFARPVTHMIYSHHHSDHASGGEVFGDAEIIAHAKFEMLAKSIGTATAMPTRTFEDEMAFTVGAKTFELTHLGRDGHGEDLITAIVRPDNVAFVVDVVSPGRLPWQRISAGSIDGLIGQIEKLESLDFDTILPGHSRIGTKEDATALKGYLNDLRASVQRSLDAGKSEAETIADAQSAMTAYRDWLAYDFLFEANVKGMIGHLTN